MKILSLNVARRAVSLVFLCSYVENHSPDIICLQEVSMRLYKLLENEKHLSAYYKYYNKKVKETNGGILILSKTFSEKILFNEINYIEKSRIIGLEFENFILITFYYPIIYYDINPFTSHYKYMKNINIKNNTMKKTINEIIIKHLKKFNNYKPVVLCGDLNEEYKSEYYLNAAFEMQKEYIKTLKNAEEDYEILHRNKKIYELENFFSCLVDFSNLGYIDVYLKFIKNHYHNNIDYFFISHKILRKVCSIKKIKNTGSDHDMLELIINL
jgi:exonuclease III